MARPLRLEHPGAIWHVTSRGNACQGIVVDDLDRARFVEILGRVVCAVRWRLHAWVLMTNHFHLLVETPDGNLARGMRQINGIYSQAFNRRHSRVGHLFQGRYKGILVERESHLLELVRRPAIIMLTIPFGMIGVILGLLITQQPFGFTALLGVISLSGIVINNAIVLIDRIKVEIEKNGLEPPRAVVEACQRRLRPILLTTATTLGGLIPLWMGGGPLFEPMAVAILFGLLFATLLTLGVVPVLYSLFFRVDFRSFRYEAANTSQTGM